MVPPIPTAAVARRLVTEIRCAVRPSRWRRPVAARDAVEGQGAGREVRASAKRASRPGDDDRARFVVGVGAIERLDDCAAHLEGEGAEFVGPIEGDGEDALGLLAGD
jgi:hypothetical protein